MKILITLCARGGSKGIPGKNIKKLAGKPLIEYTIEVAIKFAERHNAHLALSTDDADIKAAAAHAGLHTSYTRPEELATDQAGKISTIRHLLFYEEGLCKNQYDYILDLDLTAPLRTIKDLGDALVQFEEDEHALTLFSVNPAGRNPYFNMVESNDKGYYDLVKKSLDGSVMSRQKAPPVYELNASFYWYRRSFFDMEMNSPITEKSLVFVMDHICFDLDHPIDFEFLEYLIINRKIDIL